MESIHILIGKLNSDEDFRNAFRRDPEATLGFGDLGGAISPYEARALLSADQFLSARIAEEVDARLRKASLWIE